MLDISDKQLNSAADTAHQKTGNEYLDCSKKPSIPDEIGSLEDSLRSLALAADQTAASLISALARFDELKGWQKSGAPNCTGWMVLNLGMSHSLAWEKLRVAHALRKLPVTMELFSSGLLSWSKVRALSRVATPESEQALTQLALDLTAKGVIGLCENLRLKDPDQGKDDAALDQLRFERRSLSWSYMEDGNTLFRLVLPPEMAANFRRCLERAEDLLFASSDHMENNNGSASSNACSSEIAKGKEPLKPTAAQRRADASIAMAESSLSADGIGLSSADRYQVIVHVDAAALDMGAMTSTRTKRSNHADTEAAPEPTTANTQTSEQGSDVVSRTGTSAVTNSRGSGSQIDSDHAQPRILPSRKDDDANIVPLPLAHRIALQGGRGLSAASVQRMICDASLVTQLESRGTPVSIGRKSRIWPEPIRRACLIRDGGTCRWPGCSATRWLDVHHMKHWLLGGETSVDNGVTLCRSCHTRTHAEGWHIERLETTPGPIVSKTGENPPGNQSEAEALLQSGDTTEVGEGILPAECDHTLPLRQTLEEHVTRYRFTQPESASSKPLDEAALAREVRTENDSCCKEEYAVYNVPASEAPPPERLYTCRVRQQSRWQQVTSESERSL